MKPTWCWLSLRISNDQMLWTMQPVEEQPARRSKMNEYVLALLLFGSAFGLLISGIPIWAGLAGISVLFILIFSPTCWPCYRTYSTVAWTVLRYWQFRSSFFSAHLLPRPVPAKIFTKHCISGFIKFQEDWVSPIWWDVVSSPLYAVQAPQRQRQLEASVFRRCAEEVTRRRWRRA